MASGRAVRGAALSATIVSVALGCEERDTRRPDDAPVLREAMASGRLTDRGLMEASGLVPSSNDPNLFWAQNDSGNEPMLFAFDSSGRAQGRVRVDGARNRDWEALARGPCDDGSCLYIGDVGDNDGRRDAVRVWRVREPKSGDTVSSPAVLLTFRFEDGPRDVESLWVAPDTAVYLLTKRPERDAKRGNLPARIYRVAPSAWRGTDTATARLVDSVPIVPMRGQGLSWITDAALSRRDSTGAVRLAVRTYADVYVFAVDTMTWRPTSLIARCSLHQLKERNAGEGMAWLDDGRLMFDAEGAGSRLHTGRCP